MKQKALHAESAAKAMAYIADAALWGVRVCKGTLYFQQRISTIIISGPICLMSL